MKNRISSIMDTSKKGWICYPLPCIGRHNRNRVVLAVTNEDNGDNSSIESIARAILKDALIVILDEATASIDPENEHFIQEAITDLTRGKTTIIIAHRLATIQNVGQILVMDEGRIVQRGTHEDLIGQEGIYKKFLAIRQAVEEWSI